jgi:hypothetical protein
MYFHGRAWVVGDRDTHDRLVRARQRAFNNRRGNQQSLRSRDASLAESHRFDERTLIRRWRRREAAAPEVHDDGDDVHWAHPDDVGTGTGSHVWKRISAPMVGGIFTSFVLELVVYPAITTPRALRHSLLPDGGGFAT